MYRHILIPTDGTPLSDKAIKAASSLASLCHAKITALTVIPPYEEPVYSEGVSVPASTRKKFKDATEKAAREALDKVEAVTRASGAECASTFVVGDKPWESIIRVARSEKCDLIVMASHGRGGLSGLLLGSETQKVLTHSKIPVLVCR
jgi:nucleotide-binding universal stress UspA family protein